MRRGCEKPEVDEEGRITSEEKIFNILDVTFLGIQMRLIKG